MSTIWEPHDKTDMCYDEDQEERDKLAWIEKYYGELMVPSARGGLEEVHEAPGYYSGGTRADGFRHCSSCFASVMVDGFYDVDRLSAHRAFHDRTGT